MAGRGSFIESFPLFGYDLEDYDELFHHSRFLLQMSVGTMPHKKMLRAIELYGSIVAPAIRKALT